jgi:pimeloyl-ACP methyl ester carboxylesterase
MALQARSIETKRGCKVHLLEGGRGAPLVFMHGAGGLFPENPFLDALAERFHVFAPSWPGYGDSMGEDLLEDMLDFTLHGWDVVEALGIEKPHLVGHSMGGMIAAEMACVAPHDLAKLALVCPAGIWLDSHPIPDLFSLMPHELPPLIAHDPAVAMKLLAGAAELDFNNMEVLKQFLIINARQLGTAGKILFPIPNRRLSKRLYRLQAPTQIFWGESDKLIVREYAKRWKELIPHAQLVTFPECGHMIPYEKQDEFVAKLSAFLG